MNFPTVYIHNWPETKKYDVYVGESNNIFARTRQHYQSKIKHETWQYRMMQKNASLYIIGHEHFNKSLTLDVENRLMHYLMSVDKVRQVHNGRGNPQKSYYPSEEFEGIFQKMGSSGSGTGLVAIGICRYGWIKRAGGRRSCRGLDGRHRWGNDAEFDLHSGHA